MFTLTYPPKIIFGCGTLSQLKEEAINFGKNALLVTGRLAMRKAGILAKVVNDLNLKGIKVNIFDKVEHDPSLTTVNEGINFARKQNSSVIIGLGGGSSLDTAKAIACLAPQRGTVWEYHLGKTIKRPGLPFLAVPTTAGTGAEITRNAVLTNKKKKIKKSIRSFYMISKVAIVDPELTLSCPPSVTAHSGMDALTQAIESFISKACNPITDTLALRAIDLLFHNLPQAVENGKDIQTREKVALGSLLSAMAFSNSGLGAVHGLSHPLGAHFGIPHGLACAVLLPLILELNLNVRKDKFQEMAKKMEVKRAEDVPGIIRELLKKVGISLSLQEWKIEKKDIPLLVAQSKGSSMSKNPRDLTDAELSQILESII